MKKIMIAGLMLMIAVGAFAAGAQETNNEGLVVLQPGAVPLENTLADLDELTVKGTVVFESVIPKISSGGKEYLLDAPGAMMLASYLEEGQQVEVTGYLVDDGEFPFAAGYGRGGYMRAEFAESAAGERLLVAEIEMDGVRYQMPWVGQESRFGCLSGDPSFAGRGGFGGGARMPMNGGGRRGGYGRRF